jgi:SAM-dependent methyltransferase
VQAPLPPLALRERTGATPPGQVPEQYYEEQGAHHRRRIEELLGPDWTWEGKRVLDFGCGAGRGLRYFLDVAERDTEVWGCDISEPSVEWLQTHLCPPLHVFRNGEDPPIPRPDDYFDAVWAVSVFTHVYKNWAEWMLELRRVLRPDGRLILTFLNEGMLPLWNEVNPGRPWDPDRLGMTVLRRRAPWDQGGPIVFLSEW